MADPDMRLVRNEQALLSILYADIRGSTRLVDRTAPELLLGFLNDYLGQMTQIILTHEGMVDKFTGDGVMALFGAPFPLVDHALHAVRVALAMQGAHQMVMTTWHQRGVGVARHRDWYCHRRTDCRRNRLPPANRIHGYWPGH